MRRGDSPVKELTAKPTARNYGPTGARATKANSKKISNKKTRPTPLKWVVTPCHNVNPFPDDSNVGGHDEDIPDVVAASSSSAAVEVEKERIPNPHLKPPERIRFSQGKC
ncbi:hypothetical protein Pelo_8794 [Pelomyxa schiedti]|nr:hypothetical protein Pelo_8794 [Pelomyxa schiedti]